MKSEATSIISMSSITATVETTAQSTATTEVSDDTGNTNTVVVIIVGVLVVVVVAALLFVFFIAIYCVIRRRLNSNKNGTEGNSKFLFYMRIPFLYVLAHLPSYPGVLWCLYLSNLLSFYCGSILNTHS